MTRFNASRSWKWIALLGLPLAVCAVSAVAQTPTPNPANPPGFSGIVVDANGATLGLYYPAFTSDSGVVMMQIGDGAVMVPLKSVHKQTVPVGMNPVSGGGGILFFKGSSCGGDPGAIDAVGPSGTVRAVILAKPPHDVTIYLEGAGKGKTETFNSYRYASTGHCYAGTFTRMKNIREVVDLATLFTPPYYIR